ncbi:MAG TPA: oligopeptide/dipeptide ABC transporter ATP-binding protein [Streptosporangiaceae bacterium]
MTGPVVVGAGEAGTDVAPLAEADGLSVHFKARRRAGQVHALDGIDLRIRTGETLGLVGESGCGKSTLSRALLGLVPPTAGTVSFAGQQITGLSNRAMKPLRRDMQLISQDPMSSLDPRMSVRQLVGEGLRIHKLARGSELEDRVAAVLASVGLQAADADRLPHQFSGGQRQRIGIARALVLRPRLVIADEPVSALDVSVQSQVINLLVELKREFGLTYLFVAHDLAVVDYVSDRIAVMYLGKIVELADSAALRDNPRHPYTQALMSAIPQPVPGRGRERVILSGEVPSPLDPPAGCRFRTRCPLAEQICADQEPPLVADATGHATACHFAGQPITS